MIDLIDNRLERVARKRSPRAVRYVSVCVHNSVEDALLYFFNGGFIIGNDYVRMYVTLVDFYDKVRLYFTPYALRPHLRYAPARGLYLK